VRLDLDVVRPGHDALAEAGEVAEAPGREGQQAAGRDATGQRAQERYSPGVAGDVVEHPEQGHQIVLPGLGRLLYHVLAYQAGTGPAQRVFRTVEQRRVAIDPGVGYGCAEAPGQEDAKSPVAAADVQYRQRGGQVPGQDLPARPR